MGAEVVLTRSDVGKGHPEYYQDLGAAIAKKLGAYFINQFANPDNPKAHEETTAPEIWEQMQQRLDAVVVGVGSSGTIAGLAAYFKKHAPHVELVLADPQGSILAEYIETGKMTQKGVVAGRRHRRGFHSVDLRFFADASRLQHSRRRVVLRSHASCCRRKACSPAHPPARCWRRRCAIAASRKHRNASSLSAAIPARAICRSCSTISGWKIRASSQREKFGDLRDLIGRPHGERATITVGPDDALTTAHNRLRNAGFSQLPVMEDDKLIGVVTEDDILRFAFGRPECFNEPVRNAMTKTFLRVDKSTSINNLVAMLEVRSSAAVMDGDKFLGLITRSDVLNYLRRQMKC